MASTLEKHSIILLLIIFGVLAYQSTSHTFHEAAMSKKHELWMGRHGRVYDNNVEKERRFKIFKDNVEFIESFNRDGNQTYKLEINEFADLSNDEFMASYTGNMMTSYQRPPKTSFKYENVSVVPPSMDWRETGAVTPVKNQRQCGCCWAFSAVAAMEGIIQIKTGQLISLSEQEILDCDGAPNGCNGSTMEHAFDFVIHNQGIATDVDYPYVAAESTCNSNVALPNEAKINGYQSVPFDDENALLMAVANQPVSVAVDPSRFQFYSTGILSGECGVKLIHAITAVGYGISEDGTKYWIFKNSWGSNWGENGYIRMQRDISAKEGMCGIAMGALYPTA